MTETKQKSSLRPPLRPYLWTIGLTLALWLGFVIIVYLKAQETDVELRDIHSVVRWSIAGILGAALLAYSGHCGATRSLTKKLSWRLINPK